MSWLHRRRTQAGQGTIDPERTQPLPLSPVYAPATPRVQMQRLIVHMDNTRISRRRHERTAYGVMYPDGKVALWHAENGHVELHLNLASIRMWYAWMGNLRVEFLDKEDIRG